LTTIAIIGAGPLGRWLALAAARAGFRVFLEDVMPSNLHHAQEYIRQELGPSAEGLRDAGILQVNQEGENRAGMRGGVEQGLQPTSNSAGHIGPTEVVSLLHDPLREDISAPSDGVSLFQPASRDGSASLVAQVSRERVSFVSTVEDAVHEADLVIDCVPDELESKLEILWLLDRMAPPRTVIATPTTNLSIVDLASCTYRPEKCIAIAASPRTLSDERPGSTIRLQTTPRTTPETVAMVETFWRRLGFHPVFEQAAD
jgi:3-hydroxybutyryl-CoA dehydrogenase